MHITELNKAEPDCWVRSTISAAKPTGAEKAPEAFFSLIHS